MLQQTNKVHESIIGYGTFGSKVGIVVSRFGLPTGIKAVCIGLEDIPMTKVVVQENFKNYRLQAGMITCSLKHQTPEQMYNTDPNNPIQSISTIKAFALANATQVENFIIRNICPYISIVTREEAVYV